MDRQEYNEKTTKRLNSIFRDPEFRQAKNPYRQQEKEEMIELGFKTKKAYIKAKKKERMLRHEPRKQSKK